jgi:two-component system nitrogen regulation sensor histidine kinase NtrY
MGTHAARRRSILLGLSACLVLFVALATLNAFNLKFLNPSSWHQTLVFIALSTIGFLLFVAVLFLLVRNVLRLYTGQRSRVLGTRLRTRMLWGAVLVSLVPLTFMFAFSYLLMNRAVDRWFSQPVTEMRDDANDLAASLIQYATANARAEADSVAVDLSALPAFKGHNPANSTMPSAQAINAMLLRHEVTLQGGFAIIYQDAHPVAQLHAPQNGPMSVQHLHPAETDTDEDLRDTPTVDRTSLDGAGVLTAAQHNDGTIYSVRGTDYVLASAASQRGSIVVVGIPAPPGVWATTQRMRSASDTYWKLFRERRQVRSLYMVMLALVTVLALFACCWLALNLSRQVTEPVEALADAMALLAAGNYSHRVGQLATDELGELAESFNTMAVDLEHSHARAEQSSNALSLANASLEARRAELETIIETIPNGVATLTPDRRIVIANRAFCELLDPGGQQHFTNAGIDTLFSAQVLENFDRILRRSHRMGSASAEMDLLLSTGSGPLHLSVTGALLEAHTNTPHEHLGYVLVLENLTELLRAQKQSAWKEVARRIAHEIKNPLTPISLNAEQIRRHIGRIAAVFLDHRIETPSVGVIQRSSEVITASVESMRSLVDQFSTLAEFPTAHIVAADLNTIVENSLALFAGRIQNVRVLRVFGDHLPFVLADPQALKRALSNLIDNAVEAMQTSLLRELHLTTRLLENGMVELSVADTGPGVTDDMRERLFLPYFSTKQRGTGLGLAIAAKIVQELGGTLRAEKNVPAGARFIIELRAAAADHEPQPAATTDATLTEAL